MEVLKSVVNYILNLGGPVFNADNCTYRRIIF